MKWLGNLKNHWQTWWSLGIFGFSWWYLSLFRPDGLVTYGWSTDFIRLGLTGGNWQTMPVGLWLRLIGWFDWLLPTQGFVSGYMLSTVIAALSLVGLWWILMRLQRLVFRADESVSFVVGNALIVWLLTRTPFILQGTFPERYMLVWLGMVGASLILLGNRRELNWGERIWLVLGVSFHWIFWLMTPLIVWVRRAGQVGLSPLKRMVGGVIELVSLLVGGLLTSVVFSATKAVEYGYVLPKNFWEIFQSFPEWLLRDGFEQRLVANWQIEPQFALEVARLLVSLVGWPMILLGLVGLLKLAFSPDVRMRILAGLSWWLMVWPAWFGGYDQSRLAGVLELYSLIWVGVLAWLAWGGLVIVAHRLVAAVSILHNERIAGRVFRLVSGVGLMIWMIIPIVNLQPWHDERVVWDSLWQKTDVSDRLIVCFDDVSCGGLLYTLAVERTGGENQAWVVPYTYHPASMSVDVERFRPFHYADYPYFLHEIVTTAMHDEKVRVYAPGMSGDYLRFLGFDAGFFHYVPQGNWGEIRLTTPEAWPERTGVDPAWFGGGMQTEGLLDRWPAGLIGNRVLNAMVYFRSGYYTQGYDEMNDTSVVARNYPLLFGDFLSARNNAEQQVKNPLFMSAGRLESATSVLDEIPLYIEAGYLGKAAELARGAIMLSPYDHEVRERVAGFYREIGMDELAEVERANLEALKRMDF